MNSMTVEELVVDGAVHSLDERPLPERFHEIAEFAVLASPIDPFDPMDRAFKDLARRTSPVPSTCTTTGSWCASIRCRRSCWPCRTCGGRPTGAGTSSPPRARRRRSPICATSTRTRRPRSANRSRRPRFDGQRVLGVARAEFSQSDELPARQHDFTFEFLGLAGLHDPVRAGVARSGRGVRARRGSGRDDHRRLSRYGARDRPRGRRRRRRVSSPGRSWRAWATRSSPRGFGP